MKKQILSEEFRRMQKLAGIITENSSIETNPNYKRGKELAQQALKNILGEDENNAENPKIAKIANIAKEEFGIEPNDSKDKILKQVEKKKEEDKLVNAVIKLLGAAGIATGVITNLPAVALLGFTTYMLGRTFQNFNK